MCRVLFLHFHVQVLFGAGVAHTMHSVRVVLVQNLLTVFRASVFLETINPEHKKKVGTGGYWPVHSTSKTSWWFTRYVSFGNR